jgi:redox-sensing transcriptional repressor
MSTKSNKTPLPTLSRLCLYKRCLSKFKSAGKLKTSSQEIAEHTGIPSYLIRKDINHLGEVGVVGRGYYTDTLITHIVTHFGINTKHTCVIVGVGALGTALVRFLRTTEGQYSLVAGFDVDKSKIGSSVEGVEILSLSAMPDIIRRNNVEIGIVSVPASSAQEAARMLIEAGIKGLVNFTPAVLSIPDSAVKVDIDFHCELEVLSFLLTHNS